MKRSTAVCLTLFLVSMFIHPFLAESAEKALPKVLELANKTFVKWGSDPVIIKAVKAQNALKMTLQQIQEMDKKWKKTPGIADFMKKLMDSECGKHLISLQKSSPAIAEIFVMDNQGANVAQTDKTSDYWQGDEAKFIKSFNKGTGAIHIGDLKFDDSTQAYLVQVSVPVKNGNVVIGAITVGVDVDRVE
jgi:hypothetical protein